MSERRMRDSLKRVLAIGSRCRDGQRVQGDDDDCKGGSSADDGPGYMTDQRNDDESNIAYRDALQSVSLGYVTLHMSIGTHQLHQSSCILISST